MKLPSASDVVQGRNHPTTTTRPSHQHVKHATRSSYQVTKVVAVATVSADLNLMASNDKPAEFYLYVCIGSIAGALVTVAALFVIVVCVFRRKNSHNCRLITGPQRSIGRMADSVTPKSDTGPGENVKYLDKIVCNYLQC